MKKILLSILLVLLAPFAFSQSFTMYPNDTIQTDLDPNAYTELKILQINQTQSVLNLGIEVLHNDIPGSWDGMVCVYGACLGYIPASGYLYDQSPVFVGDSGYVRLTAHPMQGTQQCMLRIKVYDKDNPSNEEVATWILNQTLGIDDYTGKNIDFKVFPNPASAQVQVTSDIAFDEIEIASINGKIMKKINSGELYSNFVDISDLTSGIYFLTAKSKSKVLIRSKLVVRD
ncbi:MAG: T9SS type A sorting domain-containing protein [Crocinitomicaceae bacterium]